MEPGARAGADAAVISDCDELIGAVDRAVDRAGVGDAEAARIPGFPYLRVDRLLASFNQELEHAAAFEQWVERLRLRDRDARVAELANLPPTERTRLAAQVGDDPAAAVERCAEQLRRRELASADARAALRGRIGVPDEYRTLSRVLGLYPFTSLFVANGIAQYHADTRDVFNRPLTRLPVSGQLRRYAPHMDVPVSRETGRRERLPTDAAHATESVAALLAQARNNPLAIPEPDPQSMARLYARFAPVFEIDVASTDDEIGAPRWRNGVPEVDVGDPVVYTRLSHVRHGDAILLQLNYVIWFPARPRTGALDILGGRLDGLHWRVTLDTDGRVLLYDVMHNCGCYHMFFPAERLRARPASGELEPPLMPQHAPIAGAAERIVLRVASGTHYIERVYAERDTGGRGYRRAPYDALRSLDAGDGRRRSLFGPDGVVPHTERPERWVLWPMGVPAPGAMRQWGHHATAFIGRRHFDDPDLLARLFYPPAGRLP